MAKLTARERAALPKKLFGIPEKSPGPGSYPMEDQAHARAALSRASANATPADKKRIREKVHRLYPKIGMDPSQMRPLSNMCQLHMPDANEIPRGRAAARAWLFYLKSITLDKWEQEWELEQLWRRPVPEPVEKTGLPA